YECSGTHSRDPSCAADTQWSLVGRLCGYYGSNVARFDLISPAGFGSSSSHQRKL
ncbi:uncharacterized protein METZ01_LOCUS343719, partial [marine metagenome]